MLKFKEKIASQTRDNGTKNTDIMVTFKYLGIFFFRTLERRLINCEMNLKLSWSTNSVISSNAVIQAKKFAMTDTKLYISVVNLSGNLN